MEQSRIDLLLKLQAKAENPAATEAERETYLEKVADLMAKWTIDAAMLANRKDALVEKIVKVYLDTQGALTLSHSMATMGCFIAEKMSAYGLINKPDYRAFVKRFLLVGYESDVERVTWLWKSLQTQALQTMEVACRAHPDWRWMNRNQRDRFRNSYILGYARRVAARLELKTQQYVETAGAGTDLVLRSRSEQVEAWAKNSTKVRKGVKHSYDSDGEYAGWADGARASLGDDSLGNKTREAVRS